MKASGYARFLDLPPGELELLRVRARELAATPSGADASAQIELLEVRSRGQLYVLPLSAVEGVVALSSIAAVPRGPSFVSGMVSFRGDVLLAVELALLMDSSVGFGDLRRVVSLSHGGRRLALVAESSLTVSTAAVNSFKAAGLGQHPIISGVDPLLRALVDVGVLIQHVFDAVGGAGE